MPSDSDYNYEARLVNWHYDFSPRTSLRERARDFIGVKLVGWCLWHPANKLVPPEQLSIPKPDYSCLPKIPQRREIGEAYINKQVEAFRDEINRYDARARRSEELLLRKLARSLCDTLRCVPQGTSVAPNDVLSGAPPDPSGTYEQWQEW